MSCGILKFNNKEILLVGGGSRALKKAGELMSDGAKLTCISLAFIPGIDKMDITFIQKSFENSDIEKKYFMVYALTDDRELNHQIVLETNEKGIISASYHQDKDATFVAMKYEKYDDLTVALSTSGKYPAFTKTVFDDIESVYSKRHDERLKNLGIIRTYMLEKGIQKKYLLEDLLSASIEELKFYSNAIKINKAIIFVFHGVKEKAMYAKILQFITKVGYDKAALYFSYIDDDALKKYHYFEEMNRILSLDKIKKTLHTLKLKNVIYQPMLFEKGNNYQKMMKILEGERVNDLLFSEAMLKEYLTSYLPQGNNLIVLPSLSNPQFKQTIQSIGIANLEVMQVNEEIPSMSKKGSMELHGFFVLMDEEDRRKVFSKDGIFLRLIETDYDAEQHRGILIEEEAFIDYVKKNIVK